MDSSVYSVCSEVTEGKPGSAELFVGISRGFATEADVLSKAIPPKLPLVNADSDKGLSVVLLTPQADIVNTALNRKTVVFSRDFIFTENFPFIRHN